MESKSTFTFFFFLASLVLVTGCNKDEPDPLHMLGALKFDIPSYSYPGETFLVEATGITRPEGDSVIYTFQGKHFTPDSIVAKSVQITVPDSLGTFTLTLTASAEGYTKSMTSRTTTVIHRFFTVIVEGFQPTNDSITDPRDNKVYYYKRYGNLDWFIQNLNWNGAGLTYSNVLALGTILGGLYTWDQAISGEDTPMAPAGQFNGLGAGPRGVCPPGWTIPTAEDWADLATTVSGTPMGFLDPWNGLGEVFAVDAKVNGNKLWKYHPDNEKTNIIGWNALPAGYAILSGETFSGYGQTSFWWSASSDGNKGYYRLIHYAVDRFSCASADKSAVYASVRCVRKAEDSSQNE
ncbi:MAG: FISUMP domain-containing protein [Bacteroidales bacterium]|nr:fibrobacter succinogenes major paralogous domain-containing protein [Bacteroidales bacterium]MDD2264416.1 FISUMP domain-containing protein [Bacteroidales bacterium]MDD2831650.1 FISUMP domain-containing protein [Bacteroidales bacterium]MDD3209215.1 FISUMP domain-containing protein [Bacteroidales bacterium]MDD3697500.1 FISUMP domain-containing protein [Bacteroidales bacterium]